MKKILFAFAIFLSFLTSHAQGIKFEKELSWEQVLEKAQKEKKYIFVDCFATWCGACKQMDREIFNQASVGDFFDKNFISVKLQIDSTGKEDEATKRWFATARRFQKAYQVAAFPTYLFFNEEGKLVSKHMGVMTTTAAFIEKAKVMLDPDEQYYTLLNRYHQSGLSPVLLKKLVAEAARLRDWETVKATHEQYVGLLDSAYTKAELTAVYMGITSSKSKGFAFLLENMNKFNAILEDHGRVHGVIKIQLYKEVYTQFIKGKESAVDWKQMTRYINDKAPVFSKPIVMCLRINLAGSKKDWEKFGKLKMDYYDQYVNNFDHDEKFWMNNDLWEIFQKCMDKKTLQRAAKWSRYTIDHVFHGEHAPAIDTYANLLYKLGRREEAINWEKKAVALDPSDKEINDIYAKMLKGEQTWTKSKN